VLTPANVGGSASVCWRRDVGHDRRVGDARACLALGVIGALRAKFGVAERPHIRHAPMPFLGTCIDALMTGLGVGMAAVFLILMLAAAFNALQI
jgi:hypothetical protein